MGFHLTSRLIGSFGWQIHLDGIGLRPWPWMAPLYSRFKMVG